MDDAGRLVELARAAGGTITTREAERAGISRNRLYALRGDGAFVELSRGVYRLADWPPVSHLDFVAVCKRAPYGTICLDSALARWDLIDDVPGEVHFAVPRGMTRPAIASPPTRLHVFAVPTFDLDRIEEVLPTGERYAIYTPERSVVDALRLRRRYGGGPGLEALRAYLARRDAKPRKLLAIARELHIEAPLLRALEVLG